LDFDQACSSTAGGIDFKSVADLDEKSLSIEIEAKLFSSSITNEEHLNIISSEIEEQKEAKIGLSSVPEDVSGLHRCRLCLFQTRSSSFLSFHVTQVHQTDVELMLNFPSQERHQVKSEDCGEASPEPQLWIDETADQEAEPAVQGVRHID